MMKKAVQIIDQSLDSNDSREDLLLFIKKKESGIVIR